LSGGSTVIGSVSTAVCPSGSSGVVPSVTSNVTPAGPLKPSRGVYVIVVVPETSTAPSSASTWSAVVNRGVRPSTTSTWSVMSTSSDSPASTSSGACPGARIGCTDVSPGTTTNAFALCPSTSVTV
jgi:hypothetical protein